MAHFSKAGFGRKRAQREVLDVPESKAQDKSLDRLLAVRRQRLDRYERERGEARKAWRAARTQLHDAKLAWLELRDQTNTFWAEARRAYFSMSITSGQFRKDKAIYDRMKKQTSEQRATCLEHIDYCKQARNSFFTARNRAVQANREQEKLSMLRDEIRQSNQSKET